MRPPLYDMRSQPIIFFPLLILFFFPLSGQAFWGDGQDNRPSLNLESGYDVNTVTMVRGSIIALQFGTNRHNLMLEIESDGTRMIIVLGPQRYWANHGVPVKEGDEVVARGSRAQGRDGVFYLLAQEITLPQQGVAVILRDEFGRPKWAGGQMGRGNGGGREQGRRGGWGW